jgi:uncharacterized membrane protein
MLYESLKTIHILAAALLIGSVGYSCYLWQTLPRPRELVLAFQGIQKQTWLIIMPAAIFQLATGFSMISLHHENMRQTWIIGSVIGFLAVMCSWFTFLFFLLQAQQGFVNQVTRQQTVKKYKIFRFLQSCMLFICLVSLLCMIFFMANKDTFI